MMQSFFDLAVPVSTRFRAWFGEYQRLRKIIVGTVGASILIIGVLMLVLPGPAVIVIPAGLAILATEFVWARKLLRGFKRKFMPNSSASQEGRK